MLKERRSTRCFRDAARPSTSGLSERALSERDPRIQDESMPTDPQHEFLRHTVATLAYRCSKAVRGAPESFASFRAADGVKTPLEIMAHVSGLVLWALALLRGERGANLEPLPWPDEITRFHASLEALDAFLASDAPTQASLERVFQGPIADAIWHAGQLAMLRRMAGSPIRGENYYRAEITTGRVGADQPPPVREFD